MKAVVYKGPFKSRSRKCRTRGSSARPTRSSDHSTNICGSDLHMYEGRTGVEPGTVFGHENLGESSRSARGRPDQGRATGCAAVQHRLRPLQELRARATPASA